MVAIAEREPYKFDEQEKRIVLELIKNPRISDNQLGNKTGIPVKTVNRKRKKLEEKGILNYFTYANHTDKGSGHLPARQMHLITFTEGITRTQGLDAFRRDPFNQFMTKHIFEARFGEQQGRLVLAYTLESYKSQDLLEIFNAEMVPWLHKNFGDKSIKDVKVIDLTADLRLLHNYLPQNNLANGRIKEDWPDDKIFVY